MHCMLSFLLSALYLDSPLTLPLGTHLLFAVGKDVTARVSERYAEGARNARAFPGPLYIAPLARRCLRWGFLRCSTLSLNLGFSS